MKRIADEELVREERAEESTQKWLQDAKFQEILGADSSHKSLFVLLSHPDGSQGILLANKSPFSEEKSDIEKLLATAQLQEISRNDIFGSYNIEIDPKLNLLKSQLIYPINDRLIAKYRQEEKFVIRETPELYETVTRPYIEKYQLNLNWVYNCLEKRSEVDKIVFEDPDNENGFVLLQDIKWDGKTLENLYVLAICHRHGLKSVRDLTGDDLEMLYNMRDKSLEAINQKYGLKTDQIKCYFHYQPSFYHLHVHFINLKYDAPASTTMSAILLDDVINNLELNPEHYKKSTLTFTRKNGDKLMEMFREALKN
ncbi:m7GpppX diphosphatase [Caenorhabditis elegans]|uniref:m7GpppX diphosphatase n=2 Tax=Caenorhabditis elegans TaxID=6239 RepID=DCPS_CAEEL|nr:m7GpppX diphosphatase [Caenorhabditis elegans]G5EFS4.1 RecName: Full=m7GpppX diphosphatase; AltName: Full=Decapping scavenger enzyme; AltName: Full=Heat shock-like protein; AltName: Full=Protein DCS-1; AltName: Full=Scavenger mRNA-decapping enzyme DcpS [Caenorhabditis elegans]AAL86013.1 heat shock-like protein [Caenorhabditis elegans]CAB60481.1 m7GpppX diphosphatase [Caenorhabditis elegans]|eukprot:NP_001256897.1 m7GpppX diphosphatase [Caenorhabditis elegans]